MRPTSLLMLVLSLVWITGCAKRENAPSGGGTATAPVQGGTLVYARGHDSVRLDPAHETDGESFKVMDNLYENLVSFADTTTELVPELATRWDISPGFTKGDEEEDEEDGPPGESLEGHATDPPGANPQGNATGTNAGLPIRPANRAAKWIGVVAFAVIVPLLAIAVITRAKTGTVATPTTSTPVTNATTEKANDIPPPPASTDTLEIVESAPSATTTGHTSKSPTSSGRPPRTKPDHSADKTTEKKKTPSVARTPDF